jgi:hypothetical protein
MLHPMTSARRPLLLVHLHKTGGKAIAAAVACAARHDDVQPARHGGLGASGVRWAQASKPFFARTHFPYRPHRMAEWDPVTVLRHPVTRCWSWYTYLRGQPYSTSTTAALAREAKALDVEAFFARHAHHPILRDGMTKHLAGRGYADPEPPTTGELGTALHRLQHDFSLLGVTEDLDVFWRRLRARLVDDMPTLDALLPQGLARVNGSGGRKPKTLAACPPAVRDAVEEANRLDLELYARAGTLSWRDG